MATIEITLCRSEISLGIILQANKKNWITVLLSLLTKSWGQKAEKALSASPAKAQVVPAFQETGGG
ncbi:hypothetical protein [Endozoicomonas sp. ONNA2]|uniref:hypothetical protein n=1 Tax=Endozoicomonas sp. ONNA2 TaxID=2828741 RepID=UPI002147A3C4|nr:hypothetical protein [Endozoicomonas sp. ONNA2]